MSAQLKALKANTQDIPYQDASVDIWYKKYRLKTKDGDDVDNNIIAILDDLFLFIILLLLLKGMMMPTLLSSLGRRSFKR